jgi:ribosome-associated protein
MNIEEDSAQEEKSKSQLKREARAIRDLGEELTHLAKNQLDELKLPDQLREAVDVARKITRHGGRKRQLQYIGKLMRNMDVEFIHDYLDGLKQIHQNANKQFHELEQLRDLLIEEGDPAINKTISRFPNADRQHLRQLVRQATIERKKETEPRAARNLFRYLRELTENK